MMSSAAGFEISCSCWIGKNNGIYRNLEKTMDKITIVLASYNGEKYIETMIDSIIAQDYPHWQLILSDDGSKDKTCAILQAYADKMPEKITFYRSGIRFGRPEKHFLHLLQKFHDTPYIMFCDQDDYWHPDKVRKTYELMKRTETDPAVPAMVHTDLRVVDGELKLMNPSFMQMSGISGERMQVRHLLTQNVVTGCTMMVNRALAELGTRNIPEKGIPMHDWWLAMLAAACGKTGFLNEATIDYRQHGNNSVGAKNVYSANHILKQLKNHKMALHIRSSYVHAAVFLDCFRDVLPEDASKLIKVYAGLANKNWAARRAAYIRYGFWKASLPRKLGQLLLG